VQARAWSEAVTTGLLRIKSPGGSVFDGVAIYNALKPSTRAPLSRGPADPAREKCRRDPLPAAARLGHEAGDAPDPRVIG
jgi:hypothetical protein